MEVLMGGFRTHKRSTLTPSQSTQLRHASESETTPLHRDAPLTPLPQMRPASDASPSPSPVPPHAHALWPPVASSGTDADVLARITYADVRAVQDYLAQCGFEPEGSGMCATDNDADRAGFSPVSDHPMYGHNGVSVSASDGFTEGFDDPSALAAEHDVIWGTASPFTLLSYATHQRWYESVRAQTSAVTTPSYPDRHTASTTTTTATAEVEMDCDDIPTPTRAIPFTPSPSSSPAHFIHGQAPAEPTSPPSLSPSSMSAPSWATSDFEWGRKVEESNQSKTFAAHERRSGFPIEIKCVSKEQLVLTGGLRALRNEIALQRRVSQASATAGTRYVQQLHAYFWDATAVYLVLEAVSNEDDDDDARACRNLHARLQQTTRGHLDEEEARHVLEQVLQAVDAVHRHRIIHRRVQLSTLLTTPDGHIKLSDFSGAVDAKETCAPLPSRAALDYIAPEVLRDGAWTCAADMWSVGVVAWQLLGGAVPDALLSPHRKRYGLAHVEVEFPSHLSGEARELLQGLLNEIPEKRLTAADALRQPFFLTTPTSASTHALFTPTRAAVTPDALRSPTTLSPSLRPLILTSILKKNQDEAQRGERQAEARHGSEAVSLSPSPSSSTPPSSPIPSVSALSASHSWQNYSTPPSARLRQPGGRANTMALHANDTKSHPHAVARPTTSDDLSVSLSTCSFSTGVLPSCESRPAMSSRRGARDSAAAMTRSQLSAVSQCAASPSWAVSSTTLNISSLTALTAYDEPTVNVSRLTNSDGTPNEHHHRRPIATTSGPSLHLQSWSDADSPVPSPAPRIMSHVARRKLSYSSGSLESLGTQGVSASRPQHGSSHSATSTSAGRGEAVSVVPATRGTSLSLASLTAMTSAVPLMANTTESYSPPRDVRTALAATRRTAECALQLRFDEYSTDEEDLSASGHARGDRDAVQWHAPAPLTAPKHAYAVTAVRSVETPDDDGTAAAATADGPKRRERCVVVLSPLTPCVGEGGLPSFGDEGRRVSAQPSAGSVHTQPSLSFSDSLLVSSLTQPPTAAP